MKKWRKIMIKIATINDSYIITQMAIKMWESHSFEGLENDIIETIKDNKSVFFIKYINDIPIGFAQCSLRYDYVEGTESSPVGYLEGIFVEEQYRNNGYAKELLLSCEKWAKDKGCIEFASDCELVNNESLLFHISMGFIEANRIICFKKKI